MVEISQCILAFPLVFTPCLSNPVVSGNRLNFAAGIAHILRHSLQFQNSRRQTKRQTDQVLVWHLNTLNSWGRVWCIFACEWCQGRHVLCSVDTFFRSSFGSIRNKTVSQYSPWQKPCSCVERKKLHPESKSRHTEALVRLALWRSSQLLTGSSRTLGHGVTVWRG